MRHSSLLQSLNPPQQQAVSTPPSHVLVLAGAGSGKTRVLVHRIAWLIQQHHVSPHSILAVTFTNKAAHEMRGRIEDLLGMHLGNMWVGTFHGLSHRLLRAHHQEAQLAETFQILDADDQYRLIRRIQRNLNLDETKWPPKQTQWFINKQKEEGLRPHQLMNHDNSFFTETLATVYKAYEEVCHRSDLVDFAELLLRSLELLQNNQEIRDHYRDRFQHILVDEFQDTNTIQYAWLRAFVGSQNYVMAVGDDDQSIYSWRGAKIENIHRFSADFKDALLIRLEQNYRSTQTILNAANTLIDNNTNRLGKKLWTDSSQGQPLTLYTAFNERDEAHYIVATIKDCLRNGYTANNIAVLYRSNAQSRILEECLIDYQIPYRIYGGQKFFERAEIKDALAYLRLIANRHDDAAFERVVNMPTRGIGNSTLLSLRTTGRNNGTSLWQTAQHLITSNALNTRAANALNNFLQLVTALDQDTTDFELGEQTQYVLEQSGLMAHYKKEKSEKALSRVENLEELINATLQFKADHEDLNLTPLMAFLSHVALETGEEQASPHTEYVSLMTLHAAKGLEYPVVFMSGMEEDLFPHRMSINEPNGLEEERRLCYVGMTRAMEKLYLTYAECRRLHGLEKLCRPSRFIYEIPNEAIEAVRPTPKISRPKSAWRNKQQPASTTGLHVGQRVQHQRFGKGVITNYEGSGEHTRIQVKFDKHGAKWLVASYAKLAPV